MQLQDQVTLKGTREGFLMMLSGDSEFGELLDRIREKLASAAGFFRGTGAVVEVTGRELSTEEFTQLEKALQEEYGLVLRSVMASPSERGRARSSEETESARRAAATEENAELGQEAWLSTSAVSRRAPRPSGARPQMVEDSTLFVHRNLRSGQRVSYDGSVIIIGDVNPGAEVVATGDIIVMGALRGVAHAGARGEEQSIVAAFFLAPMQLRIAGTIARAADDEGAVRFRPELARVKEGALVIEPFPGWEHIK